MVSSLWEIICKYQRFKYINYDRKGWMTMTRIKQAAALFITAALLSSSFAPAALADSKTKVGRICLTFNSDIRAGNSGGEVDVTPTGNNTNLYYVDAVEVVNDEGDDWSKSNPPEADITLCLEDEEEYTFSGTSSGSFKLTLDSSVKSRFDKIKFIDARKTDGGAAMILTVKMIFDEDADISEAAAPKNLSWDFNNPNVAVWDDVESSKYFQIQLYRNGSLVTPPGGGSPTLSIYNTFYDFTDWMSENGTYTFKVRSVKDSNNAKSRWVSSPEQKAGSTVFEGWQRAADHVRWWWQNTDGTYPASQWKEINGQWYYFDADGYMATGWVQVNGLYYYLDPTSGAMYANRYTPDNCWVDVNGVWIP